MILHPDDLYELGRVRQVEVGRRVELARMVRGGRASTRRRAARSSPLRARLADSLRSLADRLQPSAGEA